MILHTDTVTFDVYRVDSDIIPSADNSKDLGSSTVQIWNRSTCNNISYCFINNATTATTLQNAREIGGVSFNGSADINLLGR